MSDRDGCVHYHYDVCGVCTDLAEARAEIERLKGDVSHWVNCWDKQVQVTAARIEERNEARAELTALKAKIGTLFDAIKHGDQAHQEWLSEKIYAHFADKSTKPDPNCRVCHGAGFDGFLNTTCPCTVPDK